MTKSSSKKISHGILRAGVLVLFGALATVLFSAPSSPGDLMRPAAQGDLRAFLGDGSSYFSELPRDGGINGLYRSITRPASGVNRVKKPAPAAQPKRAAVPAKKTARVKPRTARASKTSAKLVRKKSVKSSAKRTVKSRKSARRVKTRRSYKRSSSRYSKKISKRRARTRAADAKGKNLRRRTVRRSAAERRITRKRGAEQRGTYKAKKSHRARRRASVSGFPTTLTPTPKKGFRYRTPDFYRGIYLTFGTATRAKRYKPLLRRARAHGINTLVVDVQPRLPPEHFTRFARESGFYLVSRVVVFQGGLKKYPPSPRHINKVLALAEESARKGYMEVQLDYIRFADPYGKHRPRFRLSLKKRYRLIEGILKMATDRIRPLGARVGADIFGRIAFNRNDVIGQKVELFAAHMDTLYPMLYPSHFYGDPGMIRNPYRPIYRGKKNCIRRSKGQARIIAYIQGFKMKVRASGLSYTRYIQRQIQASEDSGGAGYIVWNARNKYGAFFRAVRLNEELKKKRRKTRQLSRNP